MGILELILIAIGLSMDAFAVAVCQGLGMDRLNYKKSVMVALYFGVFQALMPVIGWLLGVKFERYIVSIDHWIAFALLSIIGIQMIMESRKIEDIKISKDYSINHKELLLLAIATSIDALTVGITFAFLNVSIIQSVIIIGISTFILSILGVVIGNRFGLKYKNKAECIGGIILILIGLKVLLEHLNVISF